MKHEPDDDEDDAVSGMPEGEPELTPMGIDPDAEDSDEADVEDLPGFPKDGEPDISG